MKEEKRMEVGWFGLMQRGDMVESGGLDFWGVGWEEREVM
jgi:hypothetical protein